MASPANLVQPVCTSPFAVSVGDHKKITSRSASTTLSLPETRKKRCSSCHSSKSEESFSGFATCDKCRSKKRKHCGNKAGGQSLLTLPEAEYSTKQQPSAANKKSSKCICSSDTSEKQQNELEMLRSMWQRCDAQNAKQQAEIALLRIHLCTKETKCEELHATVQKQAQVMNELTHLAILRGKQEIRQLKLEKRQYSEVYSCNNQHQRQMMWTGDTSHPPPTSLLDAVPVPAGGASWAQTPQGLAMPTLAERPVHQLSNLHVHQHVDQQVYAKVNHFAQLQDGSLIDYAFTQLQDSTAGDEAAPVITDDSSGCFAGSVTSSGSGTGFVTSSGNGTESRPFIAMQPLGVPPDLAKSNYIRSVKYGCSFEDPQMEAAFQEHMTRERRLGMWAAWPVSNIMTSLGEVLISALFPHSYNWANPLYQRTLYGIIMVVAWIIYWRYVWQDNMTAAQLRWARYFGETWIYIGALRSLIFIYQKCYSGVPAANEDWLIMAVVGCARSIMFSWTDLYPVGALASTAPLWIAIGAMPHTSVVFRFRLCCLAALVFWISFLIYRNNREMFVTRVRLQHAHSLTAELKQEHDSIIKAYKVKQGSAESCTPITKEPV